MSFLAGSPAWPGETGAPTGEVGTVWRPFCVRNFISTDAGGLLELSLAGKG